MTEIIAAPGFIEQYVYKKYATKKFLRASQFAGEWARSNVQQGEYMLCEVASEECADEVVMGVGRRSCHILKRHIHDINDAGSMIHIRSGSYATFPRSHPIIQFHRACCPGTDFPADQDDDFTLTLRTASIASKLSEDHPGGRLAARSAYSVLLHVYPFTTHAFYTTTTASLSAYRSSSRLCLLIRLLFFTHAQLGRLVYTLYFLSSFIPTV